MPIILRNKINAQYGMRNILRPMLNELLLVELFDSYFGSMDFKESLVGGVITVGVEESICFTSCIKLLT